MTIRTVLNVTPTALVIDTAGHLLGGREAKLFDDATISTGDFAIIQTHLNAGRLRLVSGVNVPSPSQGATLVGVTVSGSNLIFTDSLGGQSSVAIPGGNIDLSGYIRADDLEAVPDIVVQSDLAGYLLSQAYNPDSLAQSGAITRDSATGIVNGFDFTWADGATGHYTGVVGAQGTVSYMLTHVLTGVTTTYSQPAFTRNASGAVTNRPAITVTSGGVTPITPVPPTLTASSKTDTTVTLAGSGGSNVSTLVVKRGSTTVGTSLPLTDTGLTASTAYSYTVTATSSTGTTATGPALTVTTNAATVTPVVPSADALTATAGAAGSGQITVTGSGGSNVASRAIYRSTTSTVNTSGTAVATALPYTDSTVTAGTAYYYQEKVTSSTGDTALSNVVNATVAAAVTAPTAAPTLTLGTATVTTQPATSTLPSGASNVQYEHKATSGSTWTVDTTTGGTSYTYTGLTGNTSYDYRSAGINSAGVGPYSTVVTATTATSGPTETVLFADTFDRSDTTTTAGPGNGWVELDPTASNVPVYQIRSNQLAITLPTGTAYTRFLMRPTAAPAGSVLRVEENVVNVGVYGAGNNLVPIGLVVAANAVDTAANITERYAMGYNQTNGYWQIVKVAGGTSTTLSTTAAMAAPTTPYKLKVGFQSITSGTATLAIWLNDTVILTATDSAPLTGRYYGASVYGTATTPQTVNTNTLSDNFTAYTV